MRCKNSNSENIKKKMTDVYDPDFWQTFLDYTIRSTKMRKNTALFKVWELLVSEIVCLFFFFFGWMNYNPFKSFLNRPPPKKKTQQSEVIILFSLEMGKLSIFLELKHIIWIKTEISKQRSYTYTC